MVKRIVGGIVFCKHIISSMGDNICDFLFAFLLTKLPLKMGANSFLLEKTPSYKEIDLQESKE